VAVRLQFVLGPNVNARVIGWFSAGHLSHVDACLPMSSDFPGYLIGARSDRVGGKPPGVQIRPPDYVKFASKVIFTLPTTMLQEQSFYAFLLSQEGKPYDKRAIWAFAFNRDWRELDTWICSELQAAALESADICPPLYVAANKIEPVPLALMVSAMGAANSAGLPG
jgi:hypothetical protein